MSDALYLKQKQKELDGEYQATLDHNQMKEKNPTEVKNW